jgi:hypothetical protein
MDNIRDLISTYLSEHLTLIGDTGSGTSRVLKYESPYSRHKLHLIYISIHGTNFRMRNIDDTSDLPFNNIQITNSKIVPYTIVVNQDSFFISLENLIVFGARAGNKSMMSFKSSTFYTYANNTDYAIANLTSLYPGIQRLLENGSELFYPAYASDDTNTAFLDEPCSDIYIIVNKQSIAEGNLLTSNSVKYFVIAKIGVSATYVMRVS